jgi:phosphatidate cytidylyltransferase
VLRYRVITAVILAPLAIAAVFLLPPVYYALTFWVVAALALYEWAGLLGWRTVGLRLLFVAIFALLAGGMYTQPQYYQPLLYIGCGLWLVAVACVLLYPRGQAVFRRPWVIGPLGLAIGLVAWVGLLVIREHEQGSWWLVWLFLLVWGADIGAYFAGRRFGRHALAPSVSPAKTWEGVLGGFLLGGGVCSAIVAAWQVQRMAWVVATFALIAVAVFGDLFESLLKRATGVKDSGNLLPGHGGMLDRIDSILAVLPFMAVILV